LSDLRNQTPFTAELVPMIDASGRNVGVVIVKATYAVSRGGALRVASVQEPVSFVDEPCPEPHGDDICSPSDLVDYKPATDLLLLRPSRERASRRLNGRQIAVTVGPIRIRGTVGRSWVFGPVRRDQDPRKSFAGTYDQSWIENRMPLLPVDFDPRHNQTAPPAQTATPHLAGDESWSLDNLYEDDVVIRGRLPGQAIVVSGSVLYDYFTEIAVLDTVTIWSDRLQLTLVWRLVIRPRQKIEELGPVTIFLARLRTTRELYGVP
jgi:hypothetical protein